MALRSNPRYQFPAAMQSTALRSNPRFSNTNTMKKLLPLLLALACALPVGAQGVVADPPSWSFTATPAYVSQYMFRGTLLDGASWQPSVEADYGNFAIGVWANSPISNKVPGSSNPEIDPYGSYKWAFNDTVALQPGFTIYTYAVAPTNQGYYRCTVEPNLALVYTLGPVTLTPKVYYDVILKGPTYELSAAYTVPVKPLNTELDFIGTAGTFLLADATNTAVAVRAWGDYWLAGVSVPFAVTKTSKVAVGYAYTKGTGASKQGVEAKQSSASAVGRGVLSVSYSYTY